MGEQIIHKSLALLATKQRGRGGHDDELVEFRRGHLAGESQARTRVIAEQVLVGGAFCLPGLAPPLYRFTDDPRSWDSVRTPNRQSIVRLATIVHSPEST